MRMVCTCAVRRSLHVRIVCGTDRVIGRVPAIERETYIYVCASSATRSDQFRLPKVRITDTFVKLGNTSLFLTVSVCILEKTILNSHFIRQPFILSQRPKLCRRELPFRN